MRYYVIINGVNSLTIEGLAIRALPPISKPAMRNIREEIDGRDGDITTELGYGAYDKTLEIGLYGDYDIDRIISFFNTKGTIIFSDEPDKYYNFDIVERIDYNKLVKFRTATISIHCQPFKYPVIEEPLEEEYEYVEGSGEYITLNNTEETIFNDIELQGNTSQDGTPTPSSPIPVNVVSGDNEIVVCGKNLINNSLYRSYTNSGVTFTPNSDGSITISGTATSTVCDGIMMGNWSDNTKYINLDTTSTYTMGMVGNTNNKITMFLIHGTSVINYTRTSNTFTPNYDSVGLLMIRYIGAVGDVINTTVYPMLVKGSTTLSTYEPYQGNTYNIDLPEGMELCKIGNYQDYIYKDSDKWYLHKEIGKVVLNGSEDIGRREAQNGTYRHTVGINTSNIMKVNDSTTISPILSNKLIATSRTGTFTQIQGICYGMESTTEYKDFIIYCDETKNMTPTEFANWLSNNNLEVLYVLSTPTNTEITGDLAEQLEAIWTATSKKSQTNIIQENDDLPFYIKVSALKEGSDHLVINNTGNIYAKPTMDIEGTGVVDIYLNDVQILEADLTEANNIVIDTEVMEAYKPDTNALANRQITGDYSKIKLEPGENDLRFSGDLTKATVTRYKRWL